MKQINHIFLLSAFSFLMMKASSQANYSTRHYCCGLKYDTITLNLIAEVNADIIYYRIGDGIIQNRSIFIDRGVTPETVSQIYKSDTIIIPYWAEAQTYYGSRDSCLNLKSISGFYEVVDHLFSSKKNKKKFKRSCFNGLHGDTYVRVKATFVFLNYGQSRWLIPDFSSECLSDRKTERCKSVEKEFSSTLIIADIIKWNYLPVKRK